MLENLLLGFFFLYAVELTQETKNCFAKGLAVYILSLSRGMKDTKSNEELSVTISCKVKGMKAVNYIDLFITSHPLMPTTENIPNIFSGV